MSVAQTNPGEGSFALSAERRGDITARYGAAIKGSLANRLIAWAIVGGLALLFAYGLWVLEFQPAKVWNGIGKLGDFVVLMIPGAEDLASILRRSPTYLHALMETVAMAFLGTLLGALLALPLGLVAARNVVANRIVHFFARRSLDTIRGVDALIWALVWINVVGLGPFAGMLAIMTADIGSFGKLYSEAIEAADKKQVEGVTSTGGGPLHTIRFGLVPQVLPVIASQVLYFFESNTRSSTIIGVVGAGGIGLHLTEQIRTLEWPHVAFLILLILVTVTLIDAISARLRHAIIGKRG
jgi:phosphonate transport system permease protein